MKVNEILNEGPIWQGVKQVGGGLGQIAKGVGQGAASIGKKLATGTVKTAAALGHQQSQQAVAALNQTAAQQQQVAAATQAATATPTPATTTTATTTTAPVANTQPTSSTIIVPQTAGGGPRKPSAPQLDARIQVVQQEPIVLRYKNADFALNDQGQWAPLLSPNKKISQAAQAFFDKQHDIALGISK